MEISPAQFHELLPPTDAHVALKRMPKEERLPKFRSNSLNITVDLSDDVKGALQYVGRPVTT